MTNPWTDWNHITKIDPDKTLPNENSYEDVASTGTDAFVVGGTLDITADKMNRVISACEKADIPIFQEPSNPAVVTDHDAINGYLIPTVLNAGSTAWIVGAHQEWVRMSENISWENIHMEGYIVLNPDASVATYTDADCEQSVEEVAALAQAAEQCLGQENIYIEYSGTLGDSEVVKAVSESVEEATVFYGGGIHDYDSAFEKATHADTIVVGNLLHSEGVEALQETVDAARDA